MSTAGTPPGAPDEAPRPVLEVTFDSVEELAVAYSQHITRGALFVPGEPTVPLGTEVRVRVRPPHDAEARTARARVDQVLAPDVAQRLGREPGLGLALADSDAAELARVVAHWLTASEPQGAESPALEMPRVLVVDDDPTYRDAIAAALEARGYEVVTARDGADGLGKAISTHPDLVLTDIHMPGLDGWQLLRMLRARPALRNLGVIFLTELKSDEERLKAYKLGVDDFLSKPLSEGELEGRVARVLRSRSLAPPGDADEVLRGDVANVALSSLLALLEMERRTGILSLSSHTGTARLFIREGNVIHVELPPTSDVPAGLERLMHVLEWTSGRFELVGCAVDHEDTIGLPTQHALLECARRRDEADKG